MNSSESKIRTEIVNGLSCRISGDGPALIMIHGIISDSTFFEECQKWLSSFYTVISYDRRSYGNSTSVKYTDYTVRTQAEDVAEIIRSLQLGSAYILGNSAGGLIGLELAIQHPSLVKGLLMIEPSLGYDPSEKNKLLGWNRLLNQHKEEGKYKQVLPLFSELTGEARGSAEFSMAQMKRTYQNLSAFLNGELNEVQHYLPSRDRLKNITAPVAIAVSERGRDGIFGTSSSTAADIIGWPLFHLPGYHNTYKAFAADAAVFTHGIFSSMGKGLVPVLDTDSLSFLKSSNP